MPIGNQLGLSQEDLIHINAIRFRVQGSGSLQLRLIGLDSRLSQTLSPLTMETLPGREPQRLANFTNQRVQFELKTTEINEYFIINRIIVFAKPIWSEYPG